MDERNRPLDISRQTVGHIDHVAHIARLEHMFVVGIAVTEVKHQLDIGRHLLGEIDEDTREARQHLVAILAIGVRLIALQPREHRGGNVELDRDLIVRQGRRDLVDLALERRR